MAKKKKERSNRWLRDWHAAVLRECGTDDLCVLIEAAKLYRYYCELEALCSKLPTSAE
jgi:hypothetical protein